MNIVIVYHANGYQVATGQIPLTLKGGLSLPALKGLATKKARAVIDGQILSIKILSFCGETIAIKSGNAWECAQ